MARVLIIGYGDPSRGDEGAGWHAARILAGLIREAGVEVRACSRLTPELAGALSQARLAIFIAACKNGAPGTLSCRRVEAGETAPDGQTDPGPAGLLALAGKGRRPVAVAFTVGGRSFEPGENLSPEVAGALPVLLESVYELLKQVCDLPFKGQATNLLQNDREDDIFSVMH